MIKKISNNMSLTNNLLSILAAGGMALGFIGLTACEDNDRTTYTNEAPRSAPSNSNADNDDDGGSSFDLNISGDDGGVNVESDEDGTNTSIDINTE